MSLEAPVPGDDQFDAARSGRGDELFEGEAQCGTCHAGPTYTDAGVAWSADDKSDLVEYLRSL